MLSKLISIVRAMLWFSPIISTHNHHLYSDDIKSRRRRIFLSCNSHLISGAVRLKNGQADHFNPFWFPEEKG